MRPHACRGGLNARAFHSDQAQVSIEMGQGFDIDREVEGLSSSVDRLKQVSYSVTAFSYSLVICTTAYHEPVLRTLGTIR